MKHDMDTLVGWKAKGLALVGVDLSDKSATWCARDEAGEIRRGKMDLTPPQVTQMFLGAPHCRVVMEAGTHHRWVSERLRQLGHEVHVVPADYIRGSKRRRKNDEHDAQELMEVAGDIGRRQVPAVWHRPEDWQLDLTTVRLRDAEMRGRTMRVNAVRSAVKPYGQRFKKRDADQFGSNVLAELSGPLCERVAPMLHAISDGTRTIRIFDDHVQAILQRRPEAELLMQVYGVGPVTAAYLVSLIGDPRRFACSRDVAAALGLVPAQSQSGNSDPQLRISKSGDSMGRRLLVQCAHRVMSDKAPDSALKRWGRKLAGDGKNKARKKKAVVAVARKLAVLLHRLWLTGEKYEPLRGVKTEGE